MSTAAMLDYEKLAGEYARHRSINPDVLQALLSGTSLSESSRVLEVGCGTGNYIAAIQHVTGADCWGIDPSAGMLAAAGEHAHQVTFRFGAAEKFGCGDQRFDLVYSIDVIHHVDDRAAFYRESSRVLKAGGRICTVTDSDEDIRRRGPLSNYFPETVAVEMERYPPMECLKASMKEAGFTELVVDHVAFSYPLDNLAPYQQRAFSCLHLIDDGAYQRGILRMETELEEGPIEALSLYTLLWGTA